MAAATGPRTRDARRTPRTRGAGCRPETADRTVPWRARAVEDPDRLGFARATPRHAAQKCRNEKEKRARRIVAPPGEAYIYMVQRFVLYSDDFFSVGVALSSSGSLSALTRANSLAAVRRGIIGYQSSARTHLDSRPLGVRISRRRHKQGGRCSCTPATPHSPTQACARLATLRCASSPEGSNRTGAQRNGTKASSQTQPSHAPLHRPPSRPPLTRLAARRLRNSRDTSSHSPPPPTPPTS